MILVSGFNVYPNVVEGVVAAHPGVLEVAAVAQPDERAGEVVVLFVVRKDPALTEQALIEHCRESLTGYKVPKRVEFRDELPKTNVGKILRRELRDELRHPAAPRTASGAGAQSCSGPTGRPTSRFADVRPSRRSRTGDQPAGTGRRSPGHRENR